MAENILDDGPFRRGKGAPGEDDNHNKKHVVPSHIIPHYHLSFCGFRHYQIDRIVKLNPINIFTFGISEWTLD